MKTMVKVAFLSSVITAAMLYVLVEWRPLQSAQPPEGSSTPEISWAAYPSNVPTAQPAVAAGSDEQNNIEIYERYGTGVVNITSNVRTYDFFFQPVQMQAGTGSGAIIDKEGHIVTNYHVIEDAIRTRGSLEVTLADKSNHRAQVVGQDPNNDLAVLKIDVPPDRLSVIPLGTSQGLRVGQKVLAIGNPFGLERTLTTGIISSLGRSIEARNGRIIEEIIQTDAAINSGNSGGPLLNSNGEIIGINTAIVAGATGLGFAIPADTVRRVVSDLITMGYVRRAYLGVRPLALTDFPGLARAMGIEPAGILVLVAETGSPAAQAGLRSGTRQVRVGNYLIPIGGDVILEFDGRSVNTVQDFLAAIDRHQPADRVEVTILRDGERLTVPVTLTEAPRTDQ